VRGGEPDAGADRHASGERVDPAPEARLPDSALALATTRLETVSQPND
jgi:hypothetical protein